MNLLNILNDIAAQAGYTISAGTGQDAINKARAIRRFTIIKSDIVSRYGGKWDANYREGELALSPIESTGTVTFTLNSRTVTGVSTAFTSAMKGYQIKGADGAFYQIASVVSATSLILRSLYQGATGSISTYIWQTDYDICPEALTVGGFIDYQLNGAMRETWPRNMQDSFGNQSYPSVPDVYTVVGRNALTTVYATGTLSVTINTNTWTGVGTSWMSNVSPGMTLVIGAYTYHVKRVNSDTELETYQLAVAAVAASSYNIYSKNALRVRFKLPTTQRLVKYWYWAKDYPLMNDNDEDWIAEMYPKVIIDGVLKYDYMDKADVIRVDRATMAYEDAIKNMKVAVDGAFTGPRTLGYYLPDIARD
jgi:uncharacterized protein Usg